MKHATGKGYRVNSMKMGTLSVRAFRGVLESGRLWSTASQVLAGR